MFGDIFSERIQALLLLEAYGCPLTGAGLSVCHYHQLDQFAGTVGWNKVLLAQLQRSEAGASGSPPDSTPTADCGSPEIPRLGGQRARARPR